MKPFIRSIGISLLLSASLAQAAPPPAWVARSNALAEPVLQEQGRFIPEAASANGKDEFDTAIIDLAPKVYERRIASLRAVRDALAAERAKESDPRVRQDLDILIKSRELSISAQEVQNQYLIGPANITRLVYFGLSTLLDARNKPERQARALVRLKRYAGLDAGYTPVATLARERTEEDLARSGLVGPYLEQLKQQLDNTEPLLKGLQALFAKAKLTGWEADLAVLSKQLRDYDVWLRAAVLPRARTEARSPAPVYADQLKQVGVDIGPEEMIERASFDYLQLRGEMQVLARQIAEKNHWPSGDYRDVIARLKRDQLASADVMPRYQERMREIENIVRREHLLTVPERKPVVRVATDAEAAQVPAPFMKPPRLIGNTGEYGEFVLPLTNPHAKSGAKMDDFTYDAITWTIASHEARPGHELQFSAMVERGVSIARAVYAFNSVNVEGWGLYSEAMMLPYMPPEAQLASLQVRMLRMMRAFLDPMINLGRISPEDAKRFLMVEGPFSEPFAQQEVDRYTFDAPGQATSYYYGFVQLEATRLQAEIALGKSFDLMAFNDFVLDQGLIPPKLLKLAVMNEFVPAQLAKAAAKN